MPKVTGFAAQVAEVEVDPTASGVKVLNLTTAHDTGTVLNHHADGTDRRGHCDRIWFCLMEENQWLMAKSQH
jgi:hypothetical protein